jgi:hypothetical protein
MQIDYMQFIKEQKDDHVGSLGSLTDVPYEDHELLILSSPTSATG